MMYNHVYYNTCSAGLDCCVFFFLCKTHTKTMMVSPVNMTMQMTAADTTVLQ